MINSRLRMPALPHRSLRFGAFEVDLERAELRKQGLRVRLQDQPFQVLVALLERPGEVVSREELIRRLWPDGTVVDYDRGLNAAVNRLRQAVSDSADVPRYIETVVRRGYLFIGHIENSTETVPTPLHPATRHGTRLWASGVLICIIALTGASWSFMRVHRSLPEAELKVVPLTSGSGV